MSHRLLPSAVGVVAAILVSGLLAVAAEPPELRYGFEKGRDYCYHVTIVGEVSDLTSTYRGVLAHKVVAADDSQFQFSSASELFPDHRNREGRLVVVLPHISPASPPSPSMPMWLGGMPMGRLGAEYTGFSRKGKFIGSQSEQFLPFVLGLQHSLVVEPLPEKSEASWSHEEAEVAVLKRMSGSSIFSHFAKFRAATNISGSETIQYNIVERKENVVRIKKVYSLKTPPDGDMVRFDMSGEGEFEFDVNRGLIQSLKMQYKILVNEKNMTLAIPVSVEYTVFSDAEMAERQQKQDVVATPGGTGKPAVFEPGEREQLIAKLQSGNEADIVAAGHRLAQIAPTAEREDVVRALTVAGSGRSMLAWVGLVRALGVWRTPETEKLLIDALNDQRGMLFGGEILAALAKFRTPDAAKAVAKSMRSVHLRMAVPGALAAMGPVA
ncbi:MAG: HEAT repeat domain-containing protein, partial [Patescibacteria group bacterium]|nr:HEAT repeat domain-containing protein [Patescibacteria group bacterium]